MLAYPHTARFNGQPHLTATPTAISVNELLSLTLTHTHTHRGAGGGGRVAISSLMGSPTSTVWMCRQR